MFLISKFEKLLWNLNSVLILLARGGPFNLWGGGGGVGWKWKIWEKKNSCKAFTVKKNHATRMAIKICMHSSNKNSSTTGQLEKKFLQKPIPPPSPSRSNGPTLSAYANEAKCSDLGEDSPICNPGLHNYWQKYSFTIKTDLWKQLENSKLFKVKHLKIVR